MSQHRLGERDKPWVMRTYAGHSDARRSNELYRRNLAKGQTGLSVAFDLPTQTGYDPDHPLARGEVGKVGVSIAHKGDMHALCDGIPLDEMNTSMTINATAAWLLALYVDGRRGERNRALEPQGHDPERHHQGVPVAGHLRLPAGALDAADRRHGGVHGQRGAELEPDQRLQLPPPGGRAPPRSRRSPTRSRPRSPCSTRSRRRGQVTDEDFPRVFGRISFFVNAGVRFIEEHAKLRAMGRLWEEIGRRRYGVTEPKYLRLRYGVQVNSLGLTESQPENNVPRIVLEALAVTLGRDARARAIQLPAWNEALGLPRPWDQQWSLRIQQILANETDLLDYPDIFEGSKVMDGLVDELAEDARAEMAIVEQHGGAVEAVPYMKARLVESHRERVAKIERGEIKVVGQNCFTETEDSPLTAGADGGILTPDPEVERERARRSSAGRPNATPRRWSAPWRASPRRPAIPRRTSSRRRSRPPRRARPPASGRACCARSSATIGPPPGSARRPRAATGTCSRRRASGSPRSRSGSATGSGSWSASRASTGTRTAPSRSPFAPATSAWR